MATDMVMAMDMGTDRRSKKTCEITVNSSATRNVSHKDNIGLRSILLYCGCGNGRAVESQAQQGGGS